MKLYVAKGKCRVCHENLKTHGMISIVEAADELHRQHRRKSGHWFDGELKYDEVFEGEQPVKRP